MRTSHIRARHAAAAVAVVGVLLVWQLWTRTQVPDFDVVIRGGRVVDGTGNPWFIADIGIKGDSIGAVKPRLNAAARVVDATGLVVSPGFIDVHSHSEARDDGSGLLL